MRSNIFIGAAAALVALVAADTTGEIFAYTTSDGVVNVAWLTSEKPVFVTVTPDCTAGDASTNALTVLSQARPPPNALTILSSALSTNSPVPPVTFSPAVFTSYGVTVATSSQTETAPTPVPSTPSTPIVPPVVPVPETPSYSSPPAETTATTSVVVSTTAGVPGVPVGSASEVSEITTGSITATATVPAPPPTLTGSALSSYEASVGSSIISQATASGSTALVTESSTLTTTTTGKKSPTGVLTGADHTSRQQTTTAAPPAAATNGAINQQPMAIGMVAVLGAALFV
ncbi:hypothetical protein LTR09_006690 [Extremus antarcticus]|uniref:Uncharacterized protein n=1 Tax=Extremus antarcticus TaxID=702011 RepID=A0AAJ0DKQ0_9PEZI|nr:hypothetical protein LTR09_006690 [Extremus antarcticus]